MSRRYWGAIAALIGVTALLALGWWLYERHEQRERSYQAAYQPYRDSKQIVPPGVLAEGERSIPDPQSYREEWRSERNLEAQRDMAEWAFLMIVVSGLSVLVTGVGVVYVARTLEATRAAVKEAADGTAAAKAMVDLSRENATRELRAYLSVEPGGINQLRGTTDAVGHIIVRNVGKLPAQGVYAVSRIGAVNRRGISLIVNADEAQPERVIQPGAAMIQGSSDFMTADAFREPAQYFYVWGVIYYWDGFGERRFTKFCHRYNAEARSGKIDIERRTKRCLIDPSEARYHEDGNDAD